MQSDGSSISMARILGKYLYLFVPENLRFGSKEVMGRAESNSIPCTKMRDVQMVNDGNTA